MKKQAWLWASGFLLAGLSLYFQPYFFENSSTSLSSQVSEKTASPNYCIALRGNGDAEPAHWGALARTVELLGLPRIISGGSSASISMFLLDAIAGHPLIRNQPPDLQKIRASLMLKSLLGFFSEMKNTQTWADIQALYGEYQQTKLLKKVDDVAALLNQKNYKLAAKTLQNLIDLGAIDEVVVQNLLASLNSNDLPTSKFYIDELRNTITVFGKFDAANDDNLFFRPGLINFKKAAHTFGRIGAFYSAADATPEKLQRWTDFFSTCGPASLSHSWPEIVSQNPLCATLFHEIFKIHAETENLDGHNEDQMIGKNIEALPTTSVLFGNAVAEYQNAAALYLKSNDAHFGKTFRPSNAEDIRVGYWGNAKTLNEIASHLPLNDEKSRRFLSLGPASWKTVLELSPAEPGLSPFRNFRAGNASYVSAGGWADLHPSIILKAAGCENVIYITRRGGESLFAQGVAKRLLGFHRPWEFFDAKNPEIQKINNEGDHQDLTSLWSRLYNLANASSSFRRSLKASTAVLCTNWNAYSAKDDMVKLIEDSYRSPYWINPDSPVGLSSNLLPTTKDVISGCSY